MLASPLQEQLMVLGSNVEVDVNVFIHSLGLRLTARVERGAYPVNPVVGGDYTNTLLFTAI